MNAINRLLSGRSQVQLPPGTLKTSCYLIAQSGEIGALLNLAKTTRSAFDEISYDPNNLPRFQGDRLKVSLREVYKIDIDQFVPKADEYFVKSANELKAWAIATGVFYK